MARPPGGHVFLDIIINFARGSPKDYTCQISFNSGQWFQWKRFLKFSIKTELAPPLGGHVFLDIIMNFRNLQEGHLMTIPAKYQYNLASGFSGEVFKVFYIDI